MDSLARHIQHLEVILVLDKVLFAERIHHVVEVLEPRQDLDSAVGKMPPAWKAVVVRIEGNGNLANMLGCNAVAVLGAIGDSAQDTRKQVLEDHNEGSADEIRACCTGIHRKPEVVLGASPYGAGLDIW